jgi:CO/xanthine dehydrogenase Mo-binding subunit
MTRTSTQWAPRAWEKIGIGGTAAAIANAVYDPTRVRIRELPIRLDKLQAEMRH